MLTLEEENALFLSGFPLTLLILCFFVGQRRSEENEGEIKEEIPTRFYFCVYACFLFKIEADRKTDRFRQSQKKGWMHGGWMMDEGREAERERGSDGWRDGVMYVCWYA